MAPASAYIAFCQLGSPQQRDASFSATSNPAGYVVKTSCRNLFTAISAQTKYVISGHGVPVAKLALRWSYKKI